MVAIFDPAFRLTNATDKALLKGNAQAAHELRVAIERDARSLLEEKRPERREEKRGIVVNACVAAVALNTRLEDAAEALGWIEYLRQIPNIDPSLCDDQFLAFLGMDRPPLELLLKVLDGLRDEARPRAVESLERHVSSSYPRSPDLRLHLAKALRLAGQIEEAFEQLDRATQLAPERSAALLPIWVEELPKVSGSARVQRILGNLSLRAGIDSAALEHLNLSFQLGNTSPDTLSDLVDVAVRKGEWETALAALDSWLASKENLVELIAACRRLWSNGSEDLTLQVRAMLVHANALLAQGRPDDALELFGQLVRRADQRPDLLDCPMDRLLKLQQELSGPTLARLKFLLGDVHHHRREFTSAIDAYRGAVRIDASLRPLILDRLVNLRGDAPDIITIWQLEAELLTEDDQFVKANTLLAEWLDLAPERAHEIMAAYDTLLGVMTRRFSLNELVTGPHRDALRGALLHCARAACQGNEPEKATALLERALAIFGADIALSLIDAIDNLKLRDALPDRARLLAGDALLISCQPDSALDEYDLLDRARERSSLNDRLDQLFARKDLSLEGQLRAGELAMALDEPDRAIGFFEHAFEQEEAASYPRILASLDKPACADDFSTDGLRLAALAHLFRASEEDLLIAAGLYQRLVDRDPAWAREALNQSQGWLERLPSDHPCRYPLLRLAAHAHLLLNEPERASEAAADSAVCYNTDREEAGLFVRRVQQFFPTLAAPEAALGQLALCGPEPDWTRALSHLQNAFDRDPAYTAGILLKLPKDADGTDDVTIHWQALRAAAHLQRGEILATLGLLDGLLTSYGAGTLDRIEPINRTLPAEPVAWMFQARLEAQRAGIDALCERIELVLASGAMAEIRAAQALLETPPTPLQPHVRDGCLRLLHARTLIALNDLVVATAELEQILKDEPGCRDEAMHLVGQINQARAGWESRLVLARGHALKRDLHAALAELNEVDDLPETRAPREEILDLLGEAYPDDSVLLEKRVLAALTWNNPDHFDRALDFGQCWLRASPTGGARVGAVFTGIVAPDDQRALRAGQLSAQAYWRAGEAESAIIGLRAISDGRPAARAWVIATCLEWLEEDEHAGLRLALLETLRVEQDWKGFIKAADPAISYLDQPDTSALFRECCFAALNQAPSATRAEQSALARLALYWSAASRSAELACAAARSAAAYTPVQVSAVSRQLRAAAWDEDSMVVFGYEAADLLREAGAERIDEALEIYQDFLVRSFDSHAPRVIERLAEFPANCWPAQRLRFLALVQTQPSEPAGLLALLEEIVNAVGAHTAPDLLELSRLLEAPWARALCAARALEANGKLEAAAETLLDFIRTAPHEATAAREEIDALATRHPAFLALWVAQSDAAAELEDWSSAEARYRAVWEKDLPTWAAALTGRYLRLLQALPDQAMLHWGFAECAWAAGQLEQAYAAIDRAIDLQPQDGLLAVEWVLQRLDKAPDLGYGWYLLGKVAFRAGQEQDAVDRLEAARKLPVPCEIVWLLNEMLARAYLALGQLQPALESARRAIRAAPNIPELRYLVRDIRLGMFDEQIEHARRVTESAPMAPAPVAALAALLRERGRLDEAIHMLQTALRQCTTEVILYLELEACFTTTRQAHLAAATMEEAKRRATTDAETRQVILFRLAQSLRRQMRFPEAIHQVEEILSTDSAFPGAVTLLDELQREQFLAKRRPARFPLIATLPSEDGKESHL